MSNQSNRGWQIDSLLAIGHLEASLSHLDEFIVAKDYTELAEQIYTTRKDLESELLKDCEDPNFWCVLKHLATAYVMSEEITHSSEYSASSFIVMSRVGDCLASAAEEALGLEKSECLRCLSEKLAEKKQ